MTISTKVQIPVREKASSLTLGAVQAPLLFLAVAALYAITIDTTPVRVDEYYTLFAGRSWADHTTFAILDGAYTRARLFTIIVGTTFDLFGNASILIARVPTMLMTASLVALLFVWVRTRAGLSAALVAAITLGLSGYSLDVAHFARFYAPQALLVLGAAMLVHTAAAMAGTNMAVRLVGAAVLLALGLHLQPTTVIAGAALGMWFCIERFGLVKSILLRRPWLTIAIAVSGLIFAIIILPPMVERFVSASVWAQEHQNDRLFYLREFYTQIPLILVVLPFAAAMALRRDRGLALLAIIMIGVAATVHSFAAMKAGRYLYYAMPFVALLFGLALARPVEAILAIGKQKLAAAGVPADLAGVGVGAALLMVGVGVLFLNSSYRHTASAFRQGVMELRDPAHVERPADPIWDEAAPALRNAVKPEDFVVASDDLRTIAHIRPHDMLINRSHLSDLGATRDFTIDVRTGRPILGSIPGLDRMIDCRSTGVIVVDDAHWRVAKGVPAEVADQIEARTTPVQPAIPHFHLFRWDHRPTASCPWAEPKGATA